jgi:hypothetical protein
MIFFMSVCLREFGWIWLLWMACVRVGLLALPLPGAGVTFFAAAKKVTKESSFPHPKYFMPAPAQAIGLGTAVASALRGHLGLGPRTV